MIQEIDWAKKHIVKVGSECTSTDEEITDPEVHRRKIEPWLSAIFQSEHLSLLAGNGLAVALANKAGIEPPSMNCVSFSCSLAGKVNTFAEKVAKETGREKANFEDQLRTAIDLAMGLDIEESKDFEALRQDIEATLSGFLKMILKAEGEFRKRLKISDGSVIEAKTLLTSFLLSFASRASSRERLHLFTTNYDRFLEFGFDELGIYAIDHFKGVLSPFFHSSRLDIDFHYNPPGIRGEPRYLEGVVRFTKLHGSVDWRYEDGRVRRYNLPFGADEKHSEIPKESYQTLMIFPNSAKDMDTSFYPYTELFRDFSSAVCCPNSALVTYGYGFGDSHINRIIKDMLSIPSTHLVIVSWDAASGRIKKFYEEIGNEDQFSLLIGNHFADFERLVRYYLPKSAIDQISWRKTELLKRRGVDIKENTDAEGSV